MGFESYLHSDTLPPTMQYFLILLTQFHQLGTKYYEPTGAILIQTTIVHVVSKLSLIKFTGWQNKMKSVKHRRYV